MSLTVTSAVGTSSVSQLVQDVTDCIHKLKEDFANTQVPITDDSQILHKFCSKLEFLLQYDMKERYTLLKRRRDYWDYFCDCLGSSKGSNDGIRYVKSLRENKTSLGRGRAFIRFALVHQRLADCIQQCVLNTKVTGDWYNLSSVWLQPKMSSSIIGVLYDLNDMHFDLSPRGYDLDNSWPSFARKFSGSHNWNIPISRRSSITSMDTLNFSTTSEPGEIDRLQQELVSAETARSILANTVGTLQHEREKAEQTVWMSQGELNAVHEQLHLNLTKYEDLLQQHIELQQSLEIFKSDKKRLEEELKHQSVRFIEKEEVLKHEKEQLMKQAEEIKLQFEQEKLKHSDKMENLLQKIEDVQALQRSMSNRVPSLVENLEHTKLWDSEKDHEKDKQILKLEQHSAELEHHNLMLEEELAKLSLTLEQNVSKHLKSDEDYQNLLTKLKDLETQNAPLLFQHAAIVSKKPTYEELAHKLTMNLHKDEDEDEACGLNWESIKKIEEENLSEESLSHCLPLQKEMVKLTTNIHLEDKKVDYIPEILFRNEQEIPVKCSDNEMKVVEVFQKENHSKLSSKLKVQDEDLDSHTDELEKLQQSMTVLLELLSDLHDCSDMTVTHKVQKIERILHFLQTHLLTQTTNEDIFKKPYHFFHNGLQKNKWTQVNLEIECQQENLEEVPELSRASHNHVFQTQNLNTTETSNIPAPLPILDKESHLLTLERDSQHISAFTLQTLRLKQLVEDDQKNLTVQKTEEYSTLKKSLLEKDEDLWKQNTLQQEEYNLNEILEEIIKQVGDLISEKNDVLMELATTKTSFQEKEVKLYEEIHHLNSELEKMVQERHKISSFSVEENVLSLEKQTMVSNLEEKNVELQSTVHNLTEENADLSQVVEHCKNQLFETENEKQKLIGLLQEDRTKLEDDLFKMGQYSEGLIKELEKVREETKEIKEELEKAKTDIYVSRNENELLRTRSSSSEKSELEESLEKLQVRFSELQLAMDLILKEKDEMSGSQITLQEENLDLKQNLAAASDNYRFLLQSSQKVNEEKDNEIKQLKLQITELQEIKVQFLSREEVATQEQISLREKLQCLEVNNKCLIENENEMVKNLREKAKEIEELKQLVQTLTSCVSEIEQDSRSHRDMLEHIEKKFQEQEGSYITQIESLQQEISALQFQLSAEEMQYEESLKAMGIQVNKMAEVTLQLSDQKSTISHLESEVSSLRSIIETDRKRHTAEICELTVQLREKEAESVKMADKYQWISNRLEQVLSENGFYERENATFLERKNTLERNIEEKDIEIKTLKSDNNQLKKQLIKAIREKATLWQQSDTLAFEYKRKAHEKWMDSSRVTKCMGCSAEFSLFLRKHHCRLCGHIFCWSCSDNWVDSPSSSQKARACITCFKELQDLDSNISRLVVPEDSDDDTSNVDSEITSPSDLQADASASYLHEIVSLESLNPENSSKASSVEDIYRTIDKSKMDSSNSILSDPTASDQTSNVTSGASISESQLKDCVFHVITQEEITKSIVAYDSSSVVQQSLISVPNILLYAEDLAADKINKNSEIWVKPGHSFAIPICVEAAFTLISWEFTVHPKDIQFSITYHCNNSQPLSQAEIVLSPRRCNSVKEPIKGVLTAKKTGVYTLVFDNSYSRLTAKKIHYQLQSSGNN